jgi:hypothetical protein
MDLGVLHCIPSIEPAYGGPVVVARGLCRELSARGARVSVLAASSGSAEKDRKNASAFGKTDFVWTKPLVRRFYWEPFLEKKTEALTHPQADEPVYSTLSQPPEVLLY